MRYILTALVLAGVAGGAWAIGVGEYAIEVFGLEDGGFLIKYIWIELGAGGDYAILLGDEKVGTYPSYEEYHYETATFHVDSLADIKPTPAEMEKR